MRKTSDIDDPNWDDVLDRDHVIDQLADFVTRASGHLPRELRDEADELLMTHDARQHDIVTYVSEAGCLIWRNEYNGMYAYSMWSAVYGECWGVTNRTNEFHEHNIRDLATALDRIL